MHPEKTKKLVLDAEEAVLSNPYGQERAWLGCWSLGQTWQHLLACVVWLVLGVAIFQLLPRNWYMVTLSAFFLFVAVGNFCAFFYMARTFERD